MAHVDPGSNAQRIVAFTVWTENARIDLIDSIAEMFVQIFIKMVVPFNGARIKNREVISLLAVFETTHESAVFLLLFSQPKWRKMEPGIDHVFETRLMKGLLHRVVLLPRPLAWLAFNGTPGHIIFVRHQANIFKMDLRVHRRRRFHKIAGSWKSAHRSSLDETDRQVSGGNVPWPSVEDLVCLGEDRFCSLGE